MYSIEMTLRCYNSKLVQFFYSNVIKLFEKKISTFLPFKCHKAVKIVNNDISSIQMS